MKAARLRLIPDLIYCLCCVSGGEGDMRRQTVKAASPEQGQGDLPHCTAGGAEETAGRSGHAHSQQEGKVSRTRPHPYLAGARKTCLHVTYSESESYCIAEYIHTYKGFELVVRCITSHTKGKVV